MSKAHPAGPSASRTVIWIALVAVIAVAGSACAGAVGPGSTGPPEQSPSMTEPSETPKIGSGAESVPISGSLVESARQHLAAMLEVTIEEIAIVSEQEVTWSDGSLGCPQPGNVYTQALVDGSLIVLEHQGDRYEYHSAGDRALIYCANPSGSGYSGSK